MATNILLLPVVKAEFTIPNNSDWLDPFPGIVDGTGAAISLAGIAFAGQLRTLPGAPNPASLAFSTGAASLIITGSGSNILQFSMLAAAIGALTPQDYAFDIVATADSHNLVIAYGTIHLVQGVTR